jgi:LacI family repressor for deo operon, udp, cdd, tsx, nupC, and nupG
LREPPDAIACVNDLTAIGALEAAHQRGLAVGRSLAIAGFDGIEESAHTHPPLTTLSQPLYDIARRLVRMLVAQISDEPLEEKCLVIQPQLILRQSTTG